MTVNYKDNLLPSIIAGTINGIIFIVSAMSLAALIFTGLWLDTCLRELEFYWWGLSYLPFFPHLRQAIHSLLLHRRIFQCYSCLNGYYNKFWNRRSAFSRGCVSIYFCRHWRYIHFGGMLFLDIGSLQIREISPVYSLSRCGRFHGRTGWLIVKFSFTMMTDMDLTLSNIFLFFNMSVLIQWVPGLVLLLFFYWRAVE